MKRAPVRQKYGCFEFFEAEKRNIALLRTLVDRIKNSFDRSETIEKFGKLVDTLNFTGVETFRGEDMRNCRTTTKIARVFSQKPFGNGELLTVEIQIKSPFAIAGLLRKRDAANSKQAERQTASRRRRASGINGGKFGIFAFATLTAYSLFSYEITAF